MKSMVFIEILIGVGIILTLLIMFKAIKSSINYPIPIRYSCTNCGNKVNQLKCPNCYE